MALVRLHRWRICTCRYFYEMIDALAARSRQSHAFARCARFHTTHTRMPRHRFSMRQVELTSAFHITQSWKTLPLIRCAGGGGDVAEPRPAHKSRRQPGRSTAVLMLPTKTLCLSRVYEYFTHSFLAKGFDIEHASPPCRDEGNSFIPISRISAFRAMPAFSYT